MAQVAGKIEVPEDAEQAKEWIKEGAESPLGWAAVFYALLYLVQIQEVEEAEFDFRDVSRKLDRAFFWYGVYLCIREFGHVAGRYDILLPPEIGPEGETMAVNKIARAYNDEWDSHLSPSEADEAFAVHFERWDLPEELIEPTKQSNLIRANTGKDWMKVTRLMNAAAVAGLDWSEPYETIELIRDFFRHSPKQYVGGGSARVTGVFNQAEGWKGYEFDGPAWAGICEVLLTRPDMTRVMFVDQAFSIEHNNSGWFNKHPVTERDNDVAVEMVPGASLDAHVRALPKLLDANHEGNMKTVFEVAAEFDDYVDFRIARAGRSLGVL